MVKVKICGLTNIEDAVYADECGADLLGFVFPAESPRCVTPDKVKRIMDGLPEMVCGVGLFKDDDPGRVRDCALSCGLKYLQLHGGETPDYCGELKDMLGTEGCDIKIIKTFKVGESILGRPASEYHAADYYLFDTYHPVMMGGTGHSFDWGIVKRFEGEKPFFLAGGLTRENVKRAVAETEPFGVDVSSGVESSVGKKDKNKIKEFIINAKSTGS